MVVFSQEMKKICLRLIKVFLYQIKLYVSLNFIHYILRYAAVLPFKNTTKKHAKALFHKTSKNVYSIKIISDISKNIIAFLKHLSDLASLFSFLLFFLYVLLTKLHCT